MGKRKTTEESTSRFCPQCFESFPPHLEECPNHGAALVSLSDEQKSLVGRTFDGKYEMLELLGVGGMGTVYRARQMPIDREVALKLLNKDYLRDKMGVKRFVQEAQAASMLKSRYSAMIFDFGLASEGYLYYTMELAVGALLSGAIKDEGRLELDRALHIGIDMCRSLEEAHSHGIVHRDLKPDNVMLAEMDGHEIAKVLDFGTAKLISGKRTTTLTEVGKVAGTPEYMSPEQAQAKKVDYSSDLYSLGVVMYEMLSGKPPFIASSSIAILIKHVNDRPLPLWEAVPDADIPADVARYVMKLLSKDPAERPAGASEVRMALERLLGRFGQPLTGKALREHLTRHDRPTGGNMLLFDRSADLARTTVADKTPREVPAASMTLELDPGQLWGAADTILSNAAEARISPAEKVEDVRNGERAEPERLPTTTEERPLRSRWRTPAVAGFLVLAVTVAGAVVLLGRGAEMQGADSERSGPKSGNRSSEGAHAEPAPLTEASLSPEAPLKAEFPLPPEIPPVAETRLGIDAPVTAETPLMSEPQLVSETPGVTPPPVVAEVPRMGPVPRLSQFVRATRPRAAGDKVELTARSGVRVAGLAASDGRYARQEETRQKRNKKRRRDRRRANAGAGVSFSPDDLQ